MTEDAKYKRRPATVEEAETELTDRKEREAQRNSETLTEADELLEEQRIEKIEPPEYGDL